MNFFLILVLIISGLFCEVNGQPKINYQNLIGKWQATDKEHNSAEINFISKSKVTVVLNGQITPDSVYVIDFSKDPMPFDLITDEQSNKVILKSLLQFSNANTLKWQIFPNGIRPNSFISDSLHPIRTLKRRN